jgi:hypothetical protein
VASVVIVALSSELVERCLGLLRRKRHVAGLARRLRFRDQIRRAAALDLGADERARGLNVLAAWSLNVLAAWGLNVLAAWGLNVLAARRLNVLPAWRLNVLPARRLNVLPAWRLNVLPAWRLNVLPAWRLNVLPAWRLNVLPAWRLKVLPGADERARRLNVFAARGLDVLPARGLNILPARGLNILPARGRHLVARAGETTRKLIRGARPGRGERVLRRSQLGRAILRRYVRRPGDERDCGADHPERCSDSTSVHARPPGMSAVPASDTASRR